MTRGPTVCLHVGVVCLLLSRLAMAQGLTGTLFGAVTDEQGGVLPDAHVRISSPALMGGSLTSTTDGKGRLRFPAVPPGMYVMDVERPGFAPSHLVDIDIGAGATLERTIVLKVAGVTQSVVVAGAGSRPDARNTGFQTRFDATYFARIPTRRASMFDPIRAAPGVSPTSPSSATITTVSAFGSGINENLFLVDGTNTTCVCNGFARSELGVGFIQELQVQSVGATAEFGNMQGAVFNAITRQGSDRFLFDASYYAQPDSLTSQPVRLPTDSVETGYERIEYRDFTATLGGPAIRNRLWFFTGYQYLRDYDSQPGTDPKYPRTYEQDKVFGKLTWRLTPSLQLMQSIHAEFWVNPDPPTLVTPFEATRRRTATVPAMTLGHLTQVLSPSTVWDVRVGRFVYDEHRTPATGDPTQPSVFDRVTGVTSGAPPLFGGLKIIRTSAKATLNLFKPDLFGADHEWKFGGEVERGEQQGANVIPTGTRYIVNDGHPFQTMSSAPSNTGGLFVTAALFASDTIAIGSRVNISAGVRFNHNRAISQDLHGLDNEEHETSEIIKGLGTMYTANVWSPRLGLTAKVNSDGRTLIRASYGRYSQGVLTGEISPFHPGVSPITTMAFDAATGGYTRFVRQIDPKQNLSFDPDTRPPYTDEFFAGADRDAGRSLTMAIGYVHKRGRDFIGWSDVGGIYRQETRILPDGRSLPVFVLTNGTDAQHFLLANRPDYFLTYHGLVVSLDKRWSHGWQASGSYTYSRASGLQTSSGATAAAAQASTVAAPTVTFARDPNDLTNARGLLPNDRPHVFRLAGIADVPRTGVVISASLQYFSGKPWAATAQVVLPQGDQRIMLEPRGTRRLSSQTLLDLRISRPIQCGGWARAELMLDVLNALNDTAEESLATDDFFSANFGRPSIFMDPRRAMLSVRFTLGR